MRTLWAELALACTGGGVLAGAIAAVTTRHAFSSLRLAVDFWFAAGLLRLSGSPGWTTVLSAAGILVVRQLVSRGLRTGRTPVQPAAGRR